MIFTLDFNSLPRFFSMKRVLKSWARTSVSSLTLLGLVGCAATETIVPPFPTLDFSSKPVVCKSRAHVDIDLQEYLKTRFQTGSPVRLAIIPFSTQANLASQGNEQIGLGEKMATELQLRILSSGLVPISEVFKRHDWPGKKEEFSTGNFGALQYAREAGYDLVLVGVIDSLQSLTEMTARMRLIEVSSGITLHFGTSEVISHRRENEKNFWYLGKKSPPSQLFINEIFETLVDCLATAIETAGHDS